MTMKSISEMIAAATDTYNGKTGCACGCGGSYAAPDSAAGKKRIAKIMKASRENPFGVAWVPFSCGTEGVVEIESEDGTRVTRIYVKVGA